MNSFLLQNVGLGCSGQGMENSSGTHSSKGKLGKGSLGKGRVGGGKSREIGWQGKEDARKGRASGGDQRGSAATMSTAEDDMSEEEGDRGEEEDMSMQVHDVEVSRKRPRSKGKKVKLYQTPKDVDSEISCLKPPPRMLSREDFAKEYNLCNESNQNPHRYKKGSLGMKLAKKYFGEPLGEGGRNGFSWQQCDKPEIRAKIEELHPILYQHGPNEIPGLLKMHFAEGIAMEYEKGPKEVNWCLFGEETNKRQRNRYQQDLNKLLAFKKSLESSSTAVELRGMEWRSLKLEPGQQGVKLEGEGAVGKSVSVERLRSRTRSRLGETGGESGVSADCEGQDMQQAGTWSKASMSERQLELESLMSVVHMEGEVLKIQKKEAVSTLERCQWRRRETECLVGTFKGQMEVKAKLIEEMKGVGEDVGRELIKLEMVQEQLATEEQHLAQAKLHYEQAEADMAILVKKTECHQLEFDALVAELGSLKRGKSGASFWPRPMVYAPLEEPISDLMDYSDETMFIRVTVCSLCSFPFPQSDIIVSSCRHLYHPFCASVLFVNSSKCTAMGCKSLSHPEWHRSFGWGEPSPDLVQRALMLGLAEERKKILKDRSDAAKDKCPAAGKFNLKLSYNVLIYLWQELYDTV